MPGLRFETVAIDPQQVLGKRHVAPIDGHIKRIAIGVRVGEHRRLTLLRTKLVTTDEDRALDGSVN